ncbi:unnamed protein product, partial [Closterium sp. NIES-54]
AKISRTQPQPQPHRPTSSTSSSSSASSLTTEAAAGMWSGTGSAEPAPLSQRFLTEAELRELSFTRLRDELLALDPLNLDHVRAINQAEALYWKLSEGEREGWSDQILGFDCGGQQWVSEVCFKAGGSSSSSTTTTTAAASTTTTTSTAAASSSSTAAASSSSSSSTADIAFMEELLALIESEGIPAPAPIEQRWTSCSRSPMSPTSGAYNAANVAAAAAGSAAGSAADGGAALDDVYSWVGIIMYLPSNDPDQRASITKHFLDYKFLTARRLWDKYGAHEHWAKIEIPSDPTNREWLVARIARDFPVAKLNEYRQNLDPKNVLANDMLDVLLFPR